MARSTTRLSLIVTVTYSFSIMADVVLYNADLLEEIIVQLVQIARSDEEKVPFYVLDHIGSIVLPLRTVCRFWHNTIRQLLGALRFWNRVTACYGITRMGSTDRRELLRLTARHFPLIAQRLLEEAAVNPKPVLEVFMKSDNYEKWPDEASCAMALAMFFKYIISEWYSGMICIAGQSESVTTREYVNTFRYMAQLPLLARRTEDVLCDALIALHPVYRDKSFAGIIHTPNKAREDYYVSKTVCGSLNTLSTTFRADTQWPEAPKVAGYWRSLAQGHVPPKKSPPLPYMDKIDECLYVYMPLFRWFILMDVCNVPFNWSDSSCIYDVVHSGVHYTMFMAAALTYYAYGRHVIAQKSWAVAVEGDNDRSTYHCDVDFRYSGVNLHLRVTDSPYSNDRLIVELTKTDVCLCCYCRHKRPRD